MQQPFLYHQQAVAYFKKDERLWSFFSAKSTQQEDFTQFKNELLKNTYRLEAASEPAVYTAVDKAKTILEILHTVTVYQLMQTTDLNAFVYILPGEAHIVLSGAIMKLMDEEELLAILAHELGHIKLFEIDNNAYQVCDRILNALSADATSPAAYFETARIFDLYTELFCDQMSLKVLQNPLPVIASLVKANTALEKVSAEGYIRQATEIFEHENVVTDNISHPENFIRAYALHIYQTQPTEFENIMLPIIQGSSKLQQLDIFKKEIMHRFTLDTITYLLADKALQTEVLLNLATQYFPGFLVNKTAQLPSKQLLQTFDTTCKEYIAYVLFDFVMADEHEEQDVFKRALHIAGELEITGELKKIMQKELKLSDKKYNERFKQKQTAHA